MFLTQEDARVVVQTAPVNLIWDRKQHFTSNSRAFNITQFGPADSRDYENTVIVVYDDSKIYTFEV